MEVLEQYHEGIIALSACLAGEVAVNLRKNNYEEAKEAALRHLKIFGENNYFLEMQDHALFCPCLADICTELLSLYILWNGLVYLYAQCSCKNASD